ncbi:MAG: D-sedoheptulose 7-phosphate isomerase [Candidatus Baldrarchaeia archaeon]
MFDETVIRILKESSNLRLELINQKDQIVNAANLIIECLKKGNKVLIFGNGGSASDAQHICAELVGRFNEERRSLSAIALNSDTSVLTAIANDYGFENVFSRQVQSLAKEGDVVISISTSGLSENVLRAVKEARLKGVKTIALTGKGGGRLKDMVDIAIVVPSQSTPRIQEAHITIGHILCELVEIGIFAE